MEYYLDKKSLMNSTRDLYRRGGSYKKAAEKIQSILFRIEHEEPDPLKGIPLTNHGEGRVPNCRKYDLPKFSRLITVVDQGKCYLLFAGTHDQCEKWLDNNRGHVPVLDEYGKLCSTRISPEELKGPARITAKSDYSEGALYIFLKNDELDQLFAEVPWQIVKKLEKLDSLFEDAELLRLVGEIENRKRAAAIHDVFVLLKQGNRKSAQLRLDLFLDKANPIEETDEPSDGDEIRKVPVGSSYFSEKFARFVREANYHEWMLFMHPEQEKVAEAAYAGPTKLSGVSGSGKTCIVVKRSIVLAERYPEEEILILTLNSPLAALIADLVASCADETVTRRIKVTPFFALCQGLLTGYEPENWKLYDEQTWKSEEHVDEIWREYYRCELNNRHAEIMSPVHDSLIARNVDAERYIREEFDWIRSAMPIGNRMPYRGTERTGRSIPLDKRFRQLLLDGLNKWEWKMEQIGVTDHLGIATALFKYRDQIHQDYRCVLVDECQDFGTIELELISALTMEGPDNIFLCGDAAQHVTWKHQSLKEAGLSVPGSRSITICRNYRNSRDILQAAHTMLWENMTEEMMDTEDFEILDPEYANFSGPSPLILEAQCLENEIASALAYARSELAEHPDHKACIAFCGFSLYEIQKFGIEIGIPILDGTNMIDQDSLFLADLEQTKGFEFDLICILNVSMGVIPRVSTPEREQFRDLTRLYVAMTRAKQQLILSFSGKPSPYLQATADHILEGQWSEFVEDVEIKILGTPSTLDDLHAANYEAKPIKEMNAEEFLFLEEARGLPLRLIEKMRALVTGVGRTLDRNPVEWRTLGSAAQDIRSYPVSRQQFGPEVVKEFEQLCRKLEIL